MPEIQEKCVILQYHVKSLSKRFYIFYTFFLPLILTLSISFSHIKSSNLHDMATVNIRLRITGASKNEGTIFFQIIHRSVVRRITTGHRILTREWRGGAIVVPKSGPRVETVEAIRRETDADKDRLCRIVGRYASRRVDYTADDIVSEYRRYMRDYTLFTYMSKQIMMLKEYGKNGTSEHYAATLRSFSSFRSGEDIMIDRIDRDLIKAYEAWMTMRGLRPNTLSFYLRTLRSVYRLAVNEVAIPDAEPFKQVFTGREQTLKRALSLDKLKKLKKMRLMANPQLAYSRDMFLLSFYLRGMSFMDMALLKRENLMDGYLTYRRRKTNQLIRIKWQPEMQRIVDRYPRPLDTYLLPIFINPGDDNRNGFHRIAAGINRSLKKLGELLGVENPLTMYAARHSWATVARLNNVSLSVISEGMGHQSESTTRIYLSTLDTTAVDYANSLVIRSIR